MTTKKKLITSPLRYPGGKTRVLSTLYAALPEDMKEFREPMCGGAGLTLRVRQERPDVECWMNDAYVDCVLFWRVLQARSAELFPLLDLMRLADGRALHRYLRSLAHVELNAAWTAARLFALNRISFNGTTEAGGYSSAAARARFTPSSIARLRPVVELLAGVQITTGDYLKALQEPGESVVAFLDPPYITAKKLYGKNGSHHAFNYERLATALKETPHRWLLTIDDCPKAHELFGQWNVRPLTVSYGMNQRNGRCAAGKELLISNYTLPTEVTT